MTSVPTTGATTETNAADVGGVPFEGLLGLELPAARVLDPRLWFDADRPIELDIGSGKGMFLLQESGRRPEVNFVGVEYARKYARFSAERLARHGRTNVRVLAVDVRRLLPRLPAECLQAVHIYFPDPWWKRRHKKRRIVNPDVLAHLVRLLGDGGHLHVATDVDEYFGVMRNVIAAFPIFAPTETADAPGEPDGYLTHFERKYRLEGRDIYRASYRKNTPTS